MKVKLMNVNGTTRNGLVWGDGTRYTAENQRDKMELCAGTVIHFYEDEYLAVVMNPAHGNFRLCLARRFEPEGKVISDGTKSGCRVGTTFETVELPNVSLNAKIHFGILCALAVHSESGFIAWAHGWLDRSDRTAAAATAAATTTTTAAYAHAIAYIAAAADAAAAATYAANAAATAYAAAAAAIAYADATDATAAAAVAYATTAATAYAAAAADAAAAATYAADAATTDAKRIDFIGLLRRAVTAEA